MSSHSFNDINAALPALMGFVLGGTLQDSRNGKVRERQMVQTTLQHPGNGYLTSPARGASLPAQIAETMWLLAGRNDIGWLSHYLPRAAEFSDDGQTWRGGYGPRIRRWSVEGNGASGHIDQLAHAVDLLNQDPTTRRAVINIYDPAVDSDPGKDVPCNNWVHFIPRGHILNAHVAIRSNDLMWGFSGINHFEWTHLMNIVASLTGMTPGAITFSASSLHLYEKYWPKAERITMERGIEGGHLINAPKFEPATRSVRYLDDAVKLFFALEDLIRTGNATLSDLAAMGEPLFRSWLHVLYSWHNPATPLPFYLHGTDLEAAYLASPKRKVPEEVEPEPLFAPGSFGEFVSQLHKEKHEAYGDSWMRRGEQIGILANMARKVDRLGVAGGGDTSADTVIDLAVYTTKYLLWLQNRHADAQVALTGDRHVEEVDKVLAVQAKRAYTTRSNADRLQKCTKLFNLLETAVTVNAPVERRSKIAHQLLEESYPLAARLWHSEANATRSWNPEAGEAS